MATVWNASGICTGIKPQFFLTDTSDDLGYLTSRCTPIPLASSIYIASTFSYHVQTCRSWSGYFDVAFIRMIITMATINVSVMWFWVCRKKSNASIAVSLPERNQLEINCLLSPLNTHILFRIEQGQGDLMCIKLNQYFCTAWQIVTEIILSCESHCNWVLESLQYFISLWELQGNSSKVVWVTHHLFKALVHIQPKKLN